jgi:hypothetical protein
MRLGGFGSQIRLGRDVILSINKVIVQGRGIKGIMCSMCWSSICNFVNQGGDCPKYERERERGHYVQYVLVISM